MRVVEEKGLETMAGADKTKRIETNERRCNQAKAKTIKEDATHGIGKRKIMTMYISISLC